MQTPDKVVKFVNQPEITQGFSDFPVLQVFEWFYTTHIVKNYG